MSWLLKVSLIQLFLVYLTLVFLIGTALHIRDYRHALGLVLSVPGRWPRPSFSSSSNTTASC